MGNACNPCIPPNPGPKEDLFKNQNSKMKRKLETHKEVLELFQHGQTLVDTAQSYLP